MTSDIILAWITFMIGFPYGGQVMLCMYCYSSVVYLDILLSSILLLGR